MSKIKWFWLILFLIGLIFVQVDIIAIKLDKLYDRINRLEIPLSISKEKKNVQN